MPVDTDAFRAGMRRLAGSVCLITTVNADGSRSGLTATAVSSVSAEPPTLLVCVNRQNTSYKAIVAAGIFAVNVLSLEDRPLSDRFASRIVGEERFAEGLWLRGETGAPLLESALVSFDCRISSQADVGTHGILFGEIQTIGIRQPDGQSLLYAHGSYGGFNPIGTVQSPDHLWWFPSWEQFGS